MSFTNTGVRRARGSSERQRALSGPSLSHASFAHLPLPILLLLVTMLLPPELDFVVGSVRLSFQRVVLLIFLPIAAARMLTGRGPRLQSFDFLIVGAFAYYAFAVFLKEPFDKALQSGGILFVESVGGYLLARVYIRNNYQFLAAVKLLFLMVLFVGALAIPESLLFKHFARDFAASITGAPPVTWQETRIGLMRALSVFDHPILYGTFCASVFGLTWFTEPDLAKRLLRAALIVVATFFALSAGPLQGIGVAIVGIVWERVTRNIPNRVWISIGLGVLVYVLASLVTKRTPFNIILTSLVLDSGSAWYRFLIWEYGMANVWANPWIGASLGFWVRPDWMPSDSVDNYWLAIAMWGGLPSLILLVSGIVMLLRALHGRNVIMRPELRGARYGCTATILALCVVGATVYYWGAHATLFGFYLGLGAWIASPPLYGSRSPQREPGIAGGRVPTTSHGQRVPSRRAGD